MRKSTMENILHAFTGPILEGYEKLIDHMHQDLKHINGRITELRIEMNRINQPVIEMTPEIAQAITDKITAGNVYPAEYKEWIIEGGNSGPWRQNLANVRYGTIETTIHADGKIHLALISMNGEIFWQMILEPSE